MLSAVLWVSVSLSGCASIVVGSREKWSDLLIDEVRHLLPHNFPHYNTSHTELSKTEINLLANFTSWCVANEDNSQVFLDLYQ